MKEKNGLRNKKKERKRIKGIIEKSERRDKRKGKKKFSCTF